MENTYQNDDRRARTITSFSGSHGITIFMIILRFYLLFHCVGTYINCAKNNEASEKVKTVKTNCTGSKCILYHYSLVEGEKPAAFKDVLVERVNNTNFIKSQLLYTNMFCIQCYEKGRIFKVCL
jgi:hypothetical protein